MLDIKQMVFENIKGLGIPVTDNPNKKKLPYGILRTINVIPENRKNYMKNNWLLRLDIFSNYKGEKEISDYYNSKIIPAVNEMLKKEGITYMTSSCTIMDDEELGPITKHGIISFNVETMEV